MASSLVSSTEALALAKGRLSFTGSEVHGRSFPQMGMVPYGPNLSVRAIGLTTKCSLSASRPASQPRFIQHKKEAFWFYRFLSIVYDHITNPGHWTEDMRDDALELADLNDRRMILVDVGDGTGSTTLGIVKHVDAKNVTILDQSPRQLAKAKKKPILKDCEIIEGDAEDLPFPTDYADRYVSARSIEYWPDPQIWIKEAYHVLKLGGKACLIGPVYPTFWLSRFFADVGMLFTKEEEYIEWFEKAGFKDVKLKKIGPKWYCGVHRYGLIMGCSVRGVKPASGDSPFQNFKLQQKEDPSILSFWEEWSWNRDIPFLWISAATCGFMAWLTAEQEAYARENLGSNMVYEIGELFELGIQLSYLLILLGLLGVGTFFVIRQVLVRRELDLSAKELQEQVRSGDASATEYFELGAVMLRRKFYPAAMKYLQQAIEKWDGDDQDLAQVYNALGVCYVRDGKLEKGIAHFEKAVKLQPGYVTAWNNLGDAYEKKKDLDAALKAFEEVLLFDPNNQVARPRRDALKDRAKMFKGVSIKSKDS